jgi:hypothetical protein
MTSLPIPSPGITAIFNLFFAMIVSIWVIYANDWLEMRPQSGRLPASLQDVFLKIDWL